MKPEVSKFTWNRLYISLSIPFDLVGITDGWHATSCHDSYYCYYYYFLSFGKGLDPVLMFPRAFPVCHLCKSENFVALTMIQSPH
jgi:hypothetical protein